MPGLALHLLVDASFWVDEVHREPAGLGARAEQVSELAASDDRLRLRRAAERCLSDGSTEQLVLALRHDADRPMLLTLAPADGLAAGGIALTGIDIAESALDDLLSRLSNDGQLLRMVLDVVPSAVFWKDRQSRFLGANKTALDAMGVADVDEILGTSDYDYFPPDEAAAYQEDDAAVMAAGEPVIGIEETLTREDGTVELLRTSKFPFRDRSGEVVGILGAFDVVTEPMRVAKALRTSEQRYALAAEATRDGIWDLDLRTGIVDLTPRCRDLLGLPGPGRAVSLADLRHHIGKTEFARLLRAIRPALSDPATARLSARVSVTLADGAIRALQIEGTPLVSDGSVTARLVGAATDVTDEINRERDLVHRATHDDLTGLANGRALTERIGEILASDGELSLLYLDLDQFKVINDGLGHQAGDVMLRAVSERLRGECAEGDLLARLGGDEFAMLLPESAPEAAEELADRLLGVLADPIDVSGLDMYTSVSIGVVHSRGNYGRPNDVLRDADTVLHHAKAAGKGCYRVFDVAMREWADQELEQQNDIRAAVESMDFCLHYQPIFDARTLQVSGVEALIRWVPEGGEMIPPGVFLPYLEQTGLIVPVGDWVIREACRQLAQWRVSQPGLEDTRVSVNLSRVQFRSDDLVATIDGAVRSAGLRHSDLIVEVTETAIAERPERVAALLTELRDLGVCVAVDDFGIGQSSLSSLYALPADILKIDRAFVARISDVGPEPVSAAVLAMAASLGMTTVAEGVETEEQMRWLQNAGAERLQGFLLGRPASPDEIVESFFPAS